MGYTATYTGEINFKSGTTAEQIVEFANKLWLPEHYSSRTTLSLDGYGKYYEDEVHETLVQFESIVESGAITFCGEDDSHWALRFDQDVGHWKEFQGHIAFEEKCTLVSDLITANGTTATEASPSEDHE